VKTKYTIVVTIIMEGRLDGTPKHKPRRNQGATNTLINKSWKPAVFWGEECNLLIRRRKAVLLFLHGKISYGTRKRRLRLKAD
jgi:hypothetical protein